jgi:hypothetical protein
MTEQRKAVNLIAVGDISLAGPEGYDPFEHVARHMQAGDIVFGNLECTFSDAGHSVEKEIVLRTSPARAGYLHRAGFRVLNVANNHALDFGPEGLRRTLAVLREQGIHAIGIGRSLCDTEHTIIECGGVKVGFLGYCNLGTHDQAAATLLNPIDRRLILEQVSRLRPCCEIAVVSLHWGIEYTHYPSPDQIELARELVDNGTGLVLGHHPHVLQGIEARGTGLIAYSLGNFQFQPRRQQSRQSLILHARIGPQGVQHHRMIPVWIDERNHPRLARGSKRKETLCFTERISAPIQEGRIVEKWWFEQTARTYLAVNMRAWITRLRRYGVRHLVPFMRWLAAGFTIKCYLGFWRARRSV